MKEVKIHSGSAGTGAMISTALTAFLKKETHLPVFLCIGSDRITGDSLGPLVGHFLAVKHGIRSFIYGTLNNTVTALNVNVTHSYIRKTHPHSKIIAIDAALGREEDIGSVRVAARGLVPGAALGNPLPAVGDISITAVVNKAEPMGALLKSTRLCLIFKLAEEIALGSKMSVDAVFPPGITVTKR